MSQNQPEIDPRNPLQVAHPDTYCPGSERSAMRRDMTWLQCSYCYTWKLSSTRIRLPAHLIEYEQGEIVIFETKKWMVISVESPTKVILFDVCTETWAHAFTNEIRPVHQS